MTIQRYTLTLTKGQRLSMFRAIERAIDDAENQARYATDEEDAKIGRLDAKLYLDLARLLDDAQEVKQ